MRFLVLATDYDGTLATDGVVDEITVAAMERLRETGRKLVMVTGRHLPDLSTVFSRFDLFDRIVVENGGLLYRPETRTEKLLCEPPNQRFIALLQERKIPFAMGRTVVATWRPHEDAVLAAIRDLGLDLQVIFNKSAVMILPSGVNKATGLQSALDEMCISPHNVVSVGDAENDHPFLRMSECSAAVANALPSLKEHSDVVLGGPRGEGVTELIDQMLADDLATFDDRLQRHSISLGQRLDTSKQNGQQQALVSPRGGSILIAGPSASGKSTAVAGILEQLVQHGYQFCLLDPEGDYDGFTEALSFGNAKEKPDTTALFRALESPRQSAELNLLGVSLHDRASFFCGLLPQLQNLRSRYARPHWLIIDEAHHLLPSSWSPADIGLPQALETNILITVHPDHVAKAALNLVEVVVAIGKEPMEVFRSFAKGVGINAPAGDESDLQPGEALVWFRNSGDPPFPIKTVRSTKERLRHVRQYAEGELSQPQSFYFRGPHSKLNLRAQNLKTFLQLAEGVDDDTWMYHLRRGDYSGWFESIIKDEELKRQAEEIERDPSASPHESRRKMKEVIEARYTAPA